MEFSKMLKQLRLEKSMTQKQVGEKLNLSESAVRCWEIRKQEPSYAVLCKLAKIFDVTVGQLLGVEEY